jgi:tagaturonate reductase
MPAFPILQFGTSRFLQAHADLFVSEAIASNESIGPIAIVQTTDSAESRRRLATFAEGQPFPVIIRGLANGAVVDTRVEVRSVRYGVHASDAWPEVERLFCEALCVISNTGDRGFELDPADDSESALPCSFPAKLAKLLLARHRAGAPPLNLMPCEPVPMNGVALREAVMQALDRWRAHEPARRWIVEECVWANSLVDRIVSEPLEPAGAIAEPYALWAIEDQDGLTTPCRHPNVVVTRDFRPYLRLKLFVLNLGHTYLAELWSAKGMAPSMTVREAIADPALRPALDSLYEEEVLPVFAGLGMASEAAAYRDTVIERFSNPFLNHRLAEIFNNHQAKKAHRFGGLIALAEAEGVRADLPRIRAALASKQQACASTAGG